MGRGTQEREAACATAEPGQPCRGDRRDDGARSLYRQSRCHSRSSDEDASGATLDDEGLDHLHTGAPARNAAGADGPKQPLGRCRLDRTFLSGRGDGAGRGAPPLLLLPARGCTQFSELFRGWQPSCHGDRAADRWSVARRTTRRHRRDATAAARPDPPPSRRRGDCGRYGNARTQIGTGSAMEFQRVRQPPGLARICQSRHAAFHSRRIAGRLCAGVACQRKPLTVRRRAEQLLESPVHRRLHRAQRDTLALFSFVLRISHSDRLRRARTDSAAENFSVTRT
jgi:hypothetical protein